MRTSRRSRIAALGVVAALTLTGACSSDSGGESDGPVKIALASPGPNEAGFPIWLAGELGYFEDNGIETEIMYAANGAALLGSGAAGDWQAGWLGSPPAITGYEKFGLVSVGVMMHEDKNLKLVMSKETLEGTTPAEVLNSAKVGTPPNSTFAQVLFACADHFGADSSTMEVVPLDPPAVRQALQAGEVSAGVTDSSGDYDLLNGSDDYEVVCDGETAGTSIIDPYVVTPDFLDENPEAAAGFVEAAYRANEFIQENPDEALEHMMDYYADAGIDGSKESAEFSMSFRQFPTLDEALAEMKDGTAEQTMRATAEFFVAGGAYEEVPDLEANFASGLTVIEAAAELRANKG